ncbi:ADOP family duplicated permease [Acidicapsa dinghuensis]|uniref:ADOP family duplicated permease n=1 Tax=Acidicapsa dinghuensis TaxID=2218256 RepID=A0ABW1EI25_9BACT|nr:ABC transporter permease [Acidicapsa dinghuensis]
MSLTGEFSRRVSMLLHRGRFRRELDEEMRLHLDLRHEQQIASGLTPKEAHWSAQRRFGNVDRIKERSHMAWGWNWLETFLQDAGYGLRSMLRTRAITMVALTSLALGIGANTAIFSFLDAIMLRSLPVKDPQGLVKLGVEDPGGITDAFANTELYSYPFYRQFQRKNAVFSETAAMYSMMNDVHGFIDDRQEPQLIHVQTVSGTYFSTLGVSAQLGRVLNETDDSSKDDHPVVVISDNFWKRTFGDDPSVLSHKVKLGNVVYDIVGVAPQEFFGTQVGVAPDAWAPLSMSAAIPPGWGGYDKNFTEGLYILGRLKPGVTTEQATANVNLLFPQILRGFPDANLSQWNLTRLSRAHVSIKSMAKGISDLRGDYSKPLMVLMVIVGLVLLIACANIANLLLARSTARARELAVRQALGAPRSRIIRQLLTESLLLALTGGALGIAFAAAADRVLLRMISQGSDTVPLDVSLNLRLLAFTFAVTVGTALLFGTLPALRATRVQLVENLKSGRGASTAAGRSPIAKILVVSQVALSLVLTVTACLFLRTLVNLNDVDTGFNKANVLRLDIDSDITGYKQNDPRLKALFKQIEDRVSALPGVTAASFSAFTFAEGSWDSSIHVPGMPVDHNTNVNHNVIGNGYFATMQIPIIAGRSFTAQDTATSQRVAIISEHVARTLFPAGSPIGHTYDLGSDSNDAAHPLTVIGVAKDVKLHGLTGSANYIDYLPYTQQDWSFGDLEVRYSGDFSSISNEVQQSIHAVDRMLPISNIRTLDAEVADTFTNQTIIAELSAFFGLMAVFLSCIGLYGLMSYLVGRRTGEIGIRMALGASRSEVAWHVLREMGLMVIAGIVIGLPITVSGIRLVRNMLYGLSGTDPLSLMAAVAFLLLAGMAAGYLPARRASTVEPVVALRDE